MKNSRNFSLLAAIAILATTSTSAFALGDVTNNGGHGGTAIANPIANGGSVLGSGNSSNLNSNLNTNTNANLNTNTNLQGQAQGQQQGQLQGQIATGGRGGEGGAGGVGYGGSASAGATSSSGGNTLTNVASNSGNNADQSTNVNVGGDTYTAARNAAATAYAAPLAASNGTCMGSSSIGAQGLVAGVSFGSTWTDTSCDARYDAQSLNALGLRGAATARLCQKADIAKAMNDAGTPCPAAKVARSTPTGAAPAPGAEAGSVQPEYRDPIIRRRLNLPPL